MVSMRRCDLFTVCILAASAVFSVSTFVHAQTPSQASINATVSTKADSLEHRVGSVEHTLEEMRLADRLARLESAADDIREVRYEMYGILAGLIGSLLSQVIQIRSNRSRRGRE